MDYKLKYLKYKNKYFCLKQQQIGGANFESIYNNGQRDGLTQQCLWISILDYLNYHLGLNVTIEEIREIASAGGTLININGEQWDETIHFQGLMNVMNIYNLSITFYYPEVIDGNISADRSVTFGNGSNHLNIVQLGGHFQLITRINNNNPLSLNSTGVNHVQPYKTDVKIATHKITENIHKVLDEEMIKILLHQSQELLFLKAKQRELNISLSRYVTLIEEKNNEIIKKLTNMSEEQFKSEQNNDDSFFLNGLQKEMNIYKELLEKIVAKINAVETFINDIQK